MRTNSGFNINHEFVEDMVRTHHANQYGVSKSQVEIVDRWPNVHFGEEGEALRASRPGHHYHPGLLFHPMTYAVSHDNGRNRAYYGAGSEAATTNLGDTYHREEDYS